MTPREGWPRIRVWVEGDSSAGSARRSWRQASCCSRTRRPCLSARSRDRRLHGVPAARAARAAARRPGRLAAARHDPAAQAAGAQRGRPARVGADARARVRARGAGSRRPAPRQDRPADDRGVGDLRRGDGPQDSRYEGPRTLQQHVLPGPRPDDRASRATGRRSPRRSDTSTRSQKGDLITCQCRTGRSTTAYRATRIVKSNDWSIIRKRRATTARCRRATRSTTPRSARWSSRSCRRCRCPARRGRFPPCSTGVPAPPGPPPPAAGQPCCWGGPCAGVQRLGNTKLPAP